MKSTTLSVEDLAAKRLDSLLASEKSTRINRDAYKNTKKLVDKVISGPLDISEYYPMAVRLGSLLKQLSCPEPGTIFAYYAPQIDPCQKGDVRYFRAICTDLAQQIDSIDHWRIRRHSLTIVK